ncbi:MAG TPA: hypothetical protein DET40_23265 [Lentisphaeria bacterium]|nr:MAG: hypothetical protein A2X45_24660 [Lentisphaerae bacterium GWF2_50_93]HCE46475.1 hypothetical protein [Lentisphaeria bacterium]
MLIRLGTSSFNIAVTAPMTECMDEYGPRFDTLGAVTGINLNGVDFCTRQGLIDEFNIHAPFSPPGFDEAKPGEVFLKIGVGELVRPDGNIYKFSHAYDIRKTAPAVIMQRENEIVMEQACRIGNGWGYEYRKIIRIVPDEAVVEIEYLLKNTGTHVIRAEQYNHNWFNFGGKAVDESYSLEHSFPLGDHAPAWFKMHDGMICLSEKITGAHYYPSNASVPAEGNRIRLSHSGTGRSVTASGDFAAARFSLYVDPAAVCPEIFVRATLEPGASEKWTRRYQFQ